MEGNKDRRINYNPADYKEIQNEAAEKSKEDLEKFYVRTKDRKYMAPCFIVFFIVIGILSIGGLIWLITESGEYSVRVDTSKIIEDVSYDICPILGDNYTSIEFFKSSDFFVSNYKYNKIDCRNLG